jgi:uncharacterized membrane protein YkvA (DUF1232 family)
MSDQQNAADRPEDGFPRERVLALVKRLPAYARLAWRLGRDPQLSSSRRAVLIAGAAYLASPIDLVPGIIPVAGQLDDAAAVLLAIRAALRGLPEAARQEHLAATDLSTALLDEDLATVRASAGWLLRRGGRLAWRGTRAAGRGVAALGRAALRQARERGASD